MNIPKMTGAELLDLAHKSDGFWNTYGRVIEAARDAQWQAALAEQERTAERVEVERKVYRNGAEHREYLNARFGPEKGGLSFPWNGHRWAYKFTGFDDDGDFDVLYRFETAPAQERAEPVAPAVGEAFNIAWRQTWGMVDPLRPPAAGSYYLGEHNGIIAALKTIRENFDHALLSATPPAPAQPSPEPQNPHHDYLRAYWQDGFNGKPLGACTGDAPMRAHREGFEAACALTAAGEREALRYAEMSMAAMREALMPSFEYVGVSLRVSQEDHAAIRSALAGLSTSLHMVRAALATKPQAGQEATAPAQPVQDKEDAERFEWAMNHMHMPEHHNAFVRHVLSVGGMGDLSDCRVFVDNVIRAARTRGDEVGK
ncbi:hypothetical protein [Hydrogenophaga sp.]|uniref:hypothetical protein n=1 Tax=Hydrogenophaga sp. TaxID=1904254 RepID=UPI003F70CE8B